MLGKKNASFICLHARRLLCPVIRLTALTTAVMAIAGCGMATMRSVPPDRLPVFKDDSSFSSLAAAVRQSRNYLRKLPAYRSFNYCGRKYSASWLLKSTETLLGIIKKSTTDDMLNRRIADKFDVCQAVGGDGDGAMLVTGYFAPRFEGSLQRMPPFIYPLYRVPDNLVGRQDVAADDDTVGRLEDGRLVPYWSRAEIEEKNLLAGYELVYLADPMDAFILQVQGSGKIRLRDGTVRRVQYAAANGRPYRSIGRLLVREGKMRLEDVDLPRLRQYMENHPAERDRILRYNESFVFFRWGDEQGPVGSLGETLTNGRSIAVDHNCFPPGALCFLRTRRPVIDKGGRVLRWTPLSRFVLVQDSGSAIKGPGRLDFFWGDGDYARIAAGTMKHTGQLYFLVEKRRNGTLRAATNTGFCGD